MDAVCVEHLSRDFGQNRGIFDLTFSIPEGEAFGLLGPNGAGKTTLIRHLMGFLRPKSGSCHIAGKDCWAHSDLVQKQVGYIPGEIAFFEDLSGIEFLRFIENYRGVFAVRQKELLERFELDPKVKLKRMSKGTKQKVAIVAALMQDPQILILDEPTSGLDPLMQNRFVELIREEKERGKTILLSSHLFEEVERTCDRVGMIRAGSFAAVDTIETLRQRHLRSYTVTLESEEKAQAFARDFSGICNGTCVTVSARLSLEEIFMDYYGGGVEQ